MSARRATMQTFAKSIYQRDKQTMAGGPPLWTWRSVLAAAGVTALTFVLIPYFQTLSSSRPQLKLARDVETTRLTPPPAPALPVPARPPADAAKRELPRPRMPQERQNLSVKAMLDLDLSLPGPQGGDFALDFPLATTNLIRDIQDLIFEAADVDEPPQPIVQLRPAYPPRAQIRKIEGRVTIEFIVTPEGRTSDIRVVESTPDEAFATSTVRAVQRWHFRPGHKEGKPVAVRVRQSVRFQMEP